MNDEKFGTIIYDGEMIDIDGADLEKLEKVSKNLKEKDDNLKKKLSGVFNV